MIERLQETCPGRLLVVEPHRLPSGLEAGGRTDLVCLEQALAADVILLLTDHRSSGASTRTSSSASASSTPAASGANAMD